MSGFRCQSWAALLVLAGLPRAQGVRLNGPIQPTLPPGEGGDVDEVLLTPDGSRIVYSADQLVNDRVELFAVPAGGSAAPIELTEPAAAGLYSPRSLRITPNGARVAFARFFTTGGFEVYSAPLDGSASELRLSAPATPGSSAGNDLELAGPRAVYRATESAFATQLFSAPLDGTAAPLVLNASLPAGTVRAFRTSPDGNKVAFEFSATGGPIELHVAPSDGSAAPVRVSGALVAGGNVFATSQGFQFTPDGTRVVYVADQDVDGRDELYCGPADGSAAPVKISGSMVAGGNVQTFGLLVTDTHAMFAADRLTNEKFELFRAPLDASTPPLKLNGTLGSNGDVSGFLPSTDGTRVVFKADPTINDAFQLFSVPVDGSAPAISLTGGIPVGRSVTLFQVAGDRAFYVADTGVDEVYELFSVPVLGGVGPTLLSALASAAGDVTAFAASADGTRAAYVADPASDEDFELFGVPADGSASPVRVSAPLVVGGDVRSVAFAGGGALLVYRADQEADETVELYSAQAGGGSAPVRLNAPLPGGPVAGDVLSFTTTRDGRRAVYAAREESMQIELYTAALGEGLVRRKLSQTLPAGADVQLDFALTEDEQFVVYRADPDGSGETELFGVRADGGGTPFPISGPLAPGGDVDSFALRPQAPGVVYRADQLVPDRYELFRWNARGAPVRLFPLAPFAAIPTFRFSPDGMWIVFSADQDVDERYEVYSVRVTGGALHKLSGALPAGASAGLFAELLVSPDSSRVLYLADQEVAGRWELFSAPIDGRSPAVKLNGTLVSGGQVAMEYLCGPRECNWVARPAPNYLILPDSSRVLYMADQEAAGVLELYAVPLDGSAPAVKLSTSGAGSLARGSLRLAPSGERAAYARLRPSSVPADGGAVGELFGVRTDGSAAPVLLTPVLASGGDVLACALEPRAGRALYVADQDANDVFELYLVPLDGSAAPRKLSAPPVTGGDVQAQSFPYPPGFESDGRDVVYLADQGTDEVLELRQAALDGSTPPRVASGNMVSGGDVVRARLASRRAYYLADQELDGVQELFLSFIVRPAATR